MVWKNIPEKKVLATLKDGKDFKGAAAEKMTIYVDGAVPGGDGDVQGVSMTIDPSTYVMTTQLKDGKGGNVGSPATVDLPLESMVVGGEYDDATKKVILTLKNGETVEFSVADLVSGLQTEITSENPLSADLVAETSNKNFVTSEEKSDIDSIPGLYTDINDVRQVLDSKQDIIDGNNPLNADYIDDSNSDKKLVTSMDLDRLEQLPGISADPYRINFQDADGNEISIDINNASAGGVTNPISYTVTFNGEPLTGTPIYHALREADCNYNSNTIILETLDPGLYLLDDYSMGMGVPIYVDSERTNVVTERKGIWLVEPQNSYSHMYYFPQEDSYSAERMVIFTLEDGEAVSDVEVATKADIGNLQPAINQANKLSADYIAETNNNKVMTSAERTKLAGIAAGAEVNVQSDWNVTNSSSDAFIKNKPTNVSAFTNDSGYQNASQVSSAIASAVGQITSFEYEVVQTLPATGEAGKIYLVANSGTTPNIYDEYIYVNNAFEKIGTTEMDLSNYYTKTQTDTLLGAKADQSTTYTKTEVDTALGNKANSSDVYTKTQVDTALGNKANSSDVYSKSEVNTALAGKQDAIDANHKLDADLIDNSTSDNKTYETGSGAPTTSTVGSVGELYVDKSTGTVYVCISDTGGTYTWEPVSGGSGPTVVQTTGQSTTDVMSQKAVTDAIDAVDGISITMTYTDPGEGSSLQANHFIAVYEV